MKYIFLVLICLCQLLSRAQNASLNSAQIIQGLQKMQVVGSVLYIAAHPDDENTRFLGYLANYKKVKATYLSLTRGDGGQNLIGKEQGIGLGLIRTNELLAARATDGAEQLFTRAYDFGYSKNPEETFAFWNRDSILSDVVLAIRKTKPDVIICRFPITGEGGHGHHTASGMLAMDAIDAAADPKQFSSQLTQYTTWQAKRLYWNAFVSSDAKEINPNHLKLDVGMFNPLLGKSYGELAAESRSCHKSQGFGSAALRGKHIEYFQYYKGDSAKSDLFENIDWTWNRFNNSEIEKNIQTIIINFDPLAPYKSTKSLIGVYQLIKSISSKNATFNFYQQEKLKELEKLIFATSGLWLEANTAEYDISSNETLNLNVQALTRYDQVPIVIKKITSNLNIDTAAVFQLLPNQIFSIKKKVTVPNNIDNNPYWLNQPIVNNKFQVAESQLIGLPKAQHPLMVKYKISILDTEFDVTKEVVHKYTDPVRGEVYRPIEVLPKVTIQLMESSIMSINGQSKVFKAIVKSHSQEKLNGTLSALQLDGWKIKIESPNFSLEKKDEEATVNILATPSKNADIDKLQLVATINGKTFNKSIQHINYDHIPHQFILNPAVVKLVPINIEIKGNKIGYIPGAGDDVANYLTQVGYLVTQLTDEDISTKDLSGYDAIITGVRAYNTNEKLATYHPKLMTYIQQGGNMIVQYNTNSRAGPLKDKIGPYPFTISRDRVTDENAAITALLPNHSALNFPNKINSSDYENWIQERGIYFASTIDSHYVKVLSMHDKDEAPLDGSLIITPYGKGNFVYTGLVFFRELPAGVPGAYRLLSNLISLPKNEK